MPSRRPHQKSRHGCVHCKERRIKCDEGRPRCRNCINRCRECHYPSSLPLTWIGQSSSEDIVEKQLLPKVHRNDLESFSVTSLSPAIAPPHISLSSSPTTGREGLTFQWFTSTIYTAAHDEGTLVQSLKYVSREALSHEFLMHGILAFSALHIAHTRTGKDQMTYLKTALDHHNQGLAIFRPLLDNVNACKPAVVIAFSALTMLFTFGYLQQPLVEPSFSPIDDIGEVFLLAKGSDRVLRETKRWNSLNKTLSDNGSLPYTSHAATTAFEHLRQINDTLNELDISHETDTYSSVIHQLESTFEEFSCDERNYHIPLSWAIKAPHRYLILLKERNPLALVILGHYCILLHNLRHIWWLHGWGTKVLQAIRYSIDNSWAPSLKWPLEQTGLL